MAVFFLGKSLPAVLSVMARYGGMVLLLLIFPACLKQYISVVFVAPAVALFIECVHPVIFVGFAPVFLK